LRRLRAGEIDVAVTWEVFGEGRDEDDGFERLVLGDDPYRIVLPAGHRLARRRKLAVADLAGERFNAPSVDPGGRYRQMLDSVFAEAGFTPEIAYLVDDVGVGRAFVAAGVCVSVMPELAVPEPRPDVVLRPIHGLDPARSVHLVWLRGRRVPAIPAMTKELARAAESRLEPAG
jgi:DNA-binding transcriptional LysR family regulator